MFNSDVLEKNDIRKEMTEVMSNYLNSPYCSLVSSGTVAIEIALKALKLARGSKVLIPDISFIATATAVANVGLLPIYADCSEKTWGLSYEGMKSAYEKYPDIKVVIVVHFAGIVNRDIVKIADFCKEKNIYLIEDCAQVFGAGYQGKKCGTFGDIGTFSFQTSKIITCGEGGMVLSTDKNIANNIAALLDWGLDLNFERKLNLPCSNYRINQIAAAFLKEQLSQADEIFQNRIKLYETFVNRLETVGLKVRLKAENESFSDIPFFVLVQSEKPKHVLHPIGEYPMHSSILVRSILDTFYPDLVETYDNCLEENTYEISNQLVNTTNFIPLHNVEINDIDRIINDLSK